MNLNAKQIIAIVGAIISVLMVANAQLTDLFGPSTAKTVTTIAGLVNMIISSVTAVLTSQGSTVKDVLAMPGVDKIDIGPAANKTLASIAVDPSIDKIGPTQSAQAQVEATAKGV